MTFLFQLANQQLTENNVWQQSISVFLLFIICYHFLIICPHILLAFDLLKNFEKMRTLGEFWKTYFKILVENFGETLEILRTFLRYFEMILCKWLEYFYEIS